MPGPRSAVTDGPSPSQGPQGPSPPAIADQIKGQGALEPERDARQRLDDGADDRPPKRPAVGARQWPGDNDGVPQQVIIDGQVHHYVASLPRAEVAGAMPTGSLGPTAAVVPGQHLPNPAMLPVPAQPPQHDGMPMTMTAVPGQHFQKAAMHMTAVTDQHLQRDVVAKPAVPDQPPLHDGMPRVTVVPGQVFPMKHGAMPMTAVPDQGLAQGVPKKGVMPTRAVPDHQTLISMRSGGIGMVMGGEGRVTMSMDVAKPAPPPPTPTAATSPDTPQRGQSAPATPPRGVFPYPGGPMCPPGKPLPKPPAGPPPPHMLAESLFASKAGPMPMMPPETVPKAPRLGLPPPGWTPF